MNTQTALEIKAFEQAQREALFDAMRAERAANGPTPLEIAQQRIRDLEAQRDSIYSDVAGWIKDLQDYFPGATGLLDVFNGIEAMEAKIAAFEARDAWMNARIDYAEYRDAADVPCHKQPIGEGFWSKIIHGDLFTFTDFIDQSIKAGK